MHSKKRDIREYPMELITYFGNRPWDGVSIFEAITKDQSRLVRRSHDCSCGMHAKTYRKDGKPARSHPTKVVKILIYFGVDDPVVLAAAYLHDAPEDVDDQILLLIEEGYPERVFAIVFRVTRTEGMPKEEHFHLIFEDFDSIIVKLADRLHNLRNMAKNVYLNKAFTKKKLHKYVIETEKFIYPLGEKITRSDHKYAEEGAHLYLALQDAVTAAKLVLKVPQGVIKRYQGKRRQPTLF